MLNNFIIFENRAIYEIMWKKYCRARQATMRRRKYTIFVPNNKGKNTDTRTGYLILTDSPWQQWLRERASDLPYTYILSYIGMY